MLVVPVPRYLLVMIVKLGMSALIAPLSPVLGKSRGDRKDEQSSCCSNCQPIFFHRYLLSFREARPSRDYRGLLIPGSCDGFSQHKYSFSFTKSAYRVRTSGSHPLILSVRKEKTIKQVIRVAEVPVGASGS